MVVFFSVSCGPQVFFDTSPSINFNRYKKSFAFLPHVDSLQTCIFDNDIMDEHIQEVISMEMQKRNYVIDTREPELMIKFHLMVEDKEDIVNTPIYSYPWVYSPYRYPYYFYPGPIYLGNNIQRIDYQEGTLVIDAIARNSGKLIWRGWAVGKLDDPELFIEKLPATIHRIFIHFPIKPQKSRTGSTLL